MAKLSSYTYRLIREFEEATRDHAFKGAQHPDEWDEIEERLERKRAALIAHIKRLPS